jgi:hypothetical protein
LHQGARLWGSVLAFERNSGTPLHDAERHRYAVLLEPLESGSDTSSDFADGKTMTLDEAVEYALTNIK